MNFKLLLQRALLAPSNHPFVIVMAFCLYLSLLWRSSRKLERFVFIINHPGDVIQVLKQIHTALLRYVAEKLLRFTAELVLFLKYLSTNAAASKPMSVAAGFVQHTSLALQDSAQSRLEEWLEGKMDLLGDKTKQTIADPFMPKKLIDLVNELVESFLPDAKRLLIVKTDELIRYQSPVYRMIGSTGNDGVVVPHNSARGMSLNSARERLKLAAKSTSDQYYYTLKRVLPSRIYHYIGRGEGDASLVSEDSKEEEEAKKKKDLLLDEVNETDEEDEIESYVAQLFISMRCKILYISSPCDKSIWECLRDPRWLCFTLFGVLPYFGTFWWIFMLTDEYQVCNFIVSFMCSKLVTGIFLLLLGSTMYFLCATKEVATCHDFGPRVQSIYNDGILFILQVLLVWGGFLLLPYTKPCKAVSDVRDAYLVEDMERVHQKLEFRKRGGRLVDMFAWESFCTLLITFLAIVAIFVFDTNSWQLRATFFWLKTLFGLLSFPFVFFKIPLLSTLLMQTRATGYNPKGVVVLHKSKTFAMVEGSQAFKRFAPNGKEDGNNGGPELSPRARFESQHLLATLSDDEDTE